MAAIGYDIGLNFLCIRVQLHFIFDKIFFGDLFFESIEPVCCTPFKQEGHSSTESLTSLYYVHQSYKLM